MCGKKLPAQNSPPELLYKTSNGPEAESEHQNTNPLKLTSPPETNYPQIVLKVLPEARSEKSRSNSSQKECEEVKEPNDESIFFSGDDRIGGSSSWGVISGQRSVESHNVALPDASILSLACVKELKRAISSIDDGSPFPIVLTFLAGSHSATVTRISSLLTEVADFYRGGRWRDAQISKIFSRRKFTNKTDPLDVFLAVVEDCFRDEFQVCHFESNLENCAFGEFQYSTTVYHEINVRYEVMFNEEIFARSLLSSTSMEEKLIFVPLNLVFWFRP